MLKSSRKSGVCGMAVLGVIVLATACSEPLATALDTPAQASAGSPPLQVPCIASVLTRTVKCGMDVGATPGIAAEIIGDQGVYVKLTSSNVSYNSDTEVFEFDVTVQNLMNEAIGTPGYTGTAAMVEVPDPEGIQVFFNSEPRATGGSGTITVANPDGMGTFTGSNQPYFTYNEILPSNAVSAAKHWQLNVPRTVTTFRFFVHIETERQYLLVIDEVFVNPGGTIIDTNGEWIEIYNAGSMAVEMQGLVISDSAASGRRPYSVISSSLIIPPGGYVVLGNTTNTTNNGGVPVDYAYGAAMNFANSLDAFKLSRAFGTDTITIDRTMYANAAVSAQNGVSRELFNPMIDNSNMDGSNWADALVTSVYGPGGRGTPKAQNSVYRL